MILILADLFTQPMNEAQRLKRAVKNEDETEAEKALRWLKEVKSLSWN